MNLTEIFRSYVQSPNNQRRIMKLRLTHSEESCPDNVKVTYIQYNVPELQAITMKFSILITKYNWSKWV